MKHYNKINCQICSKQFTPKNSRQLICSFKCYKKRDKLKEHSILDKFEHGHLKSVSIKKALKRRKYLIRDAKVIAYESSPTGKAYIGVNKFPLQPVKEGFGFKGVLLQTENREFIQCHICGKWLQKLGGGHLQKHAITKKDYQKKFSLFLGNGLVSDATSYHYEANGHKKIAKVGNEVNNKNLAKSHNKAMIAYKKLRKSNFLKDIIEHQNRYAICEAQLQFRLLSWVKIYKDLPSRSNKKADARRICKAIFRRYGSLNIGFKHFGLPTRYRVGTNVELNSLNGKQLFFNYNKDYNKDIIWDWIKENSPILQQKLISTVE